MGLESLDHAIKAADLPSGGAFTAVESYPYSELEALLAALLQQNTSWQADTILQEFGLWLAKRFKTAYAGYFDGHDNAIDFLDSVDNHIHVEVRKLNPDAVPPKVRMERVEPDVYRLTYQSHRPLAQLAMGLTQGCLMAYGDRWEIDTVHTQDEGHSMVLLLRSVPDGV